VAVIAKAGEQIILVIPRLPAVDVMLMVNLKHGRVTTLLTTMIGLGYI